MTDNNLPSIEYLHKRILCDAEKGKWFWRDCEDMPISWRSRLSGTEAFTTVDRKGYLRGTIKCKNLFSHRVIWSMHYGDWPAGQIDHINGIRTDNRITNLRVVTNQENAKNMAMKKSNKSGVTGVYWNKKAKKWRAAIMIAGKDHHLGFFSNIEDAAAVRLAALAQYGFGIRHGLPLEKNTHDPRNSLAAR